MTPPIDLVNCAENFKGLKHQIDALRWLQSQQTPEVLLEFATMFRDSPKRNEKPAPPPLNPLPVPYFSQRDSSVAGQANRMCFSSSCAMLLAYLKPGAIAGPQGDDQYLERVLTFGDTTDASAQIKALASYGIKARFVQNANVDVLYSQIDKGIPIPCGFLHHGPSSSPRGGGHWLIVIGHPPDRKSVIVNDPFGEMDVAGGTYLNSNGKRLNYSLKNWRPRWECDGPSSGWAIIADL